MCLLRNKDNFGIRFNIIKKGVLKEFERVPIVQLLDLLMLL